MQSEMRQFGVRVAQLSPQLALGLGGAAVAMWALVSAPAGFWLGNLVLGMVAGLFAVKLYLSGDGMYVLPYGFVIAMFPLVSGATIGAFEFESMFGGLVTLLAGIAVTIAMRRRSVLEANHGDA